MELGYPFTPNHNDHVTEDIQSGRKTQTSWWMGSLSSVEDGIRDLIEVERLYLHQS